MSKFKLDHHLLHSALAGPHRVEKYDIHVSRVDRTSVRADVRLGHNVCGHPGIAHGGILASLLDDAMGAAFFSARLGSGFTANLQIGEEIFQGSDGVGHTGTSRKQED